MLPEEARRSPERRLISVVFPAPLGPSSACSLPRCSSMATLFAAMSPPKRRESPCVLRTASLIVGASDERSLETATDACEAAWKEYYEQNDRCPEQQLPVRRDRLVELLQRHESECPDNPAVEAAQAAKYQHQQHIPGLVPRDDLGVHETELHRRQVACKAGERTREGKAGELVKVDGEAKRAHPVLVAVDALQRAAEGRAQQHAQENEHQQHRCEHEVIRMRRAGEIEWRKSADAGDRFEIHADAVGATPELGVVENEVEHLRER